MMRRVPLMVCLAIACLAIGVPNYRLSAQDSQDLVEPSSAVAVRQASAAPAQQSNRLYIVRMADLPVVSYEGGIAGLAATKPARGQKIDPNAGDVSAYA